MVELNFESPEPLETVEQAAKDGGIDIVRRTTAQGFWRQLNCEPPDRFLIKVMTSSLT